MLVPIESAY